MLQTVVRHTEAVLMRMRIQNAKAGDILPA